MNKVNPGIERKINHTTYHRRIRMKIQSYPTKVPQTQRNYRKFYLCLLKVFQSLERKEKASVFFLN